MAAFLPSANQTERATGLAAPSSNFSLSISSTSSDGESSDGHPVASTSKQNMGAIFSKPNAGNRKRVKRDEDELEQEQATSSSGGSQNNARNSDSTDIMASPSKKRRTERTYGKQNQQSRSVEAFIRQRKSRSPIRERRSPKGAVRDGSAIPTANELAILALNTPAADTSNGSPAEQLVPVVEVPTHKRSGTRSRDVSRDIEMQDVAGLDDTLDDIGQEEGSSTMTGKVTMSNGKIGETTTKRANKGSGKPNRPFARQSSSPSRPVLSTTISSSSPSLQIEQSPAAEERSPSPAKSDPSKRKKKRNRATASKAAKEQEDEQTPEKSKRGKTGKAQSEAEALSALGCSPQTIAAIGGGRPSRRASAVQRPSYAEPEMESDEEEGGSEEEEPEPDRIPTKKSRQAASSEEENKQLSKRAKGKGRAKQEEKDTESDLEGIEHLKTVKSKNKAKGKSHLRKTVSESNAAKPKKVEPSKKRSVSAKDIARLAAATEDEETEAVRSSSEGSSAMVVTSQKVGRTATSKTIKPVNGKTRNSESIGAPPKTSSSAIRKRSSSTASSSPLPLPFSSQQSRAAWDFDLLDNELFVAVAAAKKAQSVDEDEDLVGDDNVPNFWWPAKIVSRYRQNFRVSLVLDGKKDILDISPQEISIPATRIKEEYIVSFADSFTEQPVFPDAQAATATFHSHPSHENYRIPPTSAFISVISKAKKLQAKDDDEDLLPEINGLTYNSPHRKTPVKKQKNGKLAAGKAKGKDRAKSGIEETPDTQEEGEEEDAEVDGILRDLNARGERRIEVVDEDSEEELEAGIDVGDVCIGEDPKTKLWWPARVVKLWPGGHPRKPSAKATLHGNRENPVDGPYEVEFYPDGSAFLRRRQMKFTDDSGFNMVQWGEIAKAKDGKVEITKEEMEATLPDLVKLMQEEYPPGQLRHDLFFGSQNERTKQLPDEIHYGLFSDPDREFINTYITNWIHGRLKVECQPPTLTSFDSLDGAEKPEYIMSVLAPTALEILVINDTPNLSENARQQVQQEEEETSPAKIRQREHKLAIDELKEAAAEEWYRRMYTVRDMYRTKQNLQRKMKVSDKDLYEGVKEGRGKKKVNYAEK